MAARPPNTKPSATSKPKPVQLDGAYLDDRNFKPRDQGLHKGLHAGRLGNPRRYTRPPMATINFATREITSKIVYYGASGAGCNTNVERLWNLAAARRKGSLHKFGPDDGPEQSWYFDFVPERDPPVDGFALLWRVYSLPGGIDVVAHREEVLEGVDAVVFVADARADRGQANLDHMLELESLLARHGLELSSMPVVLQVNHIDADDARPTDDVVFDLNPYSFGVIEAVAKAGKGVLQTHEEVGSAVLARVRDTLAGQDTIALTAVHSDGVSDTDLIRQHVEKIQARSEATPQTEMDDVTVADELLEAPTVEVPFQPEAFLGSHPVRLISVKLEGDRVELGVEMRRMGGGESRPLKVHLVNRPTDSPAIPSALASQTLAAVPSDRVFDYLPEDDVFEDDEDAGDLPGVWYGILGTAGGMVIGLLLAYLLGAIG